MTGNFINLEIRLKRELKVCDDLYRFDLPVLPCLKTPVILIQPVVPAEAGIVSIHRSGLGKSRFRGDNKRGEDDGLCMNDEVCGNAGVNENKNKKIALRKQGFSN